MPVQTRPMGRSNLEAVEKELTTVLGPVAAIF
jgi:hypothetical protein